MKLRYETGVATLTQFIVIGLLNLIYAINTGAHACIKREDCLSTSVLSFAYFILLSIWFIVIAVMGYAAQQKRSKRISQALIIAEAMVALIALFNAKHHADLLGLIISLIDLTFAVWIITLAFRLMRSGGGRIRVKSTVRARTRKRSKSQSPRS